MNRYSMNPTQIAAEAAQEIKRFIEENEYANAVDFESIIQAAIEKGIQAWLCDKGWQRKTFEPIIKKAYADGHSQGEKEQG